MDIRDYPEAVDTIITTLKESNLYHMERRTLEELDTNSQHLHEVARLALKMAQGLDFYISFVRHAKVEQDN